MSKFIFRDLKLTDLYDLLIIENQSFDHPWTKTQILYEMEQNKFAVNYGLFNSDKIIGYALCHLIQNELHINNFAIDIAFRKQGLGYDLLKQTIEKSNCETSYLEVNENNLPAIKLYEKFGFKAFYKREQYYPDGATAIIMIY